MDNIMDSKTNIEALLDSLKYEPTNEKPNKEGLPYVTHTGKLNLGHVSITVYVLNTGQRIIPDGEIQRILNIKL